MLLCSVYLDPHWLSYPSLLAFSSSIHLGYTAYADRHAYIKSVIGSLCACPYSVTLMASFVNLIAFMESSDCKHRSLVSTMLFSG